MSSSPESQLCFAITCQEHGQVFSIGNDVRFALAIKDALGAHFPCSYWSVSPVIVHSLPLPATSADLAAHAKEVKRNQV